MKIELLDKACMPRYAHVNDAAMDCIARTDVSWTTENNVQVAYVPLGFKISIPKNYVLLLFSRSGQAWKSNITLSNSVGVIDSGFTGEVQAKLIRQGVSMDGPMDINKGDRVCQMMLVELPRIYLDVVDKIENTDRSNGFGGSGV